jgi:Protein of unknown function (DUF3891)
MVLYPLDTASQENRSHSAGEGYRAHGPKVAGRISAWEAVERRQKQTARSWWLVAQPDHAALSGDLAASISSSHFPKLDSEVVQAIRLHDEGWAQFDATHDRGTKPRGTTDKRNGGARPLSFLDMRPSVFMRAWQDSIRRAEDLSPLGGILVSEHFSRLAENRLQTCADSFQDMENLRGFLRHEAEQRRCLAAKIGHPDEQIHSLVEVLQFCDLLSLYLCCGAVEDVEFPQQFQGRTIVLRRAGEMCRTDPPIFGAGVSLGVSARRHPQSEAEVNATTMGFLLV